jgi:DHA2 family multidrug resistance protein-like MFS transporter
MSLVVLDAGMANVALPTLARALDASPAQAVVVVTAYQTALVMALLPCAAIGERFGNRRVFQGGVSLFIVASVFCAVAPSLPWLVAMRLLQGLGGAAVMALGVALIRVAVTPRELGAAIGWNALTVALSSAAAPPLGALIIARLDWTWLFLMNLPIGCLALLAAFALPRGAGRAGRLDFASMALNGAGFALLVVGAELLPRSPVIAAALLAAAALALTALVLREAPKAVPLIPLDLLRSRPFRVSIMASVCCFTATAAALVALPFYLQHGLGQSPLMVGLYMSPWPLSVAVTVAVSGRLSGRVPTTVLCACGGGVLAAGLAGLALWPISGDLQPFVGLAVVCGVGFGLFQPANNRNIFLSAPADRSGAAGGMQGTARLTGQTAGAVVMTLLFSAAPLTIAPRIGLGAGAGLAVLCALVSLLGRPGRAAL